MKTFNKGDKVFASVDGYKIPCVYDSLSGDGFHWVFTDDTISIRYRLTDSEIENRVVLAESLLDDDDFAVMKEDK